MNQRLRLQAIRDDMSPTEHRLAAYRGYPVSWRRWLAACAVAVAFMAVIFVVALAATLGR